MSEEIRKAEAQQEATAVIEFRGQTFTISREYDDWPIDFLEAIEDGKTVGIVRGALGPAQWHRVKAMNLKTRDLAELSEKMVAAMGFRSAGESQASSD